MGGSFDIVNVDFSLLTVSWRRRRRQQWQQRQNGDKRGDRM
jgi:hypothetical protein